MTVRAVPEHHLIRVISPPTSETRSTNVVVMTGQEMFALGDIGRAELVEGELVRMAPTGHLHGYIELRFGKMLSMFVDEYKLGRVLSGEVGIYTQRDPDTVRGADVAFISNERLAQVQSHNYLDVAPELIVEIMSPNDRWCDVNDKLTEYLNLGVQIVWVADPQRRQVHVYRSSTEIKILSVGDTLTGGDVLPGLSISVAELFE
jgi:Uma2 family endonuclease